MTKLRYTILALLAALALTFAGCGGSSSSPVNADRDGDGIPNIEDAFPDDPNRFAAFESAVEVVEGFSVAVAVADGTTSAFSVGQADEGGPILKAQRWSVDTEDLAVERTTLNPLGQNTYSAAYGVNDAGVAVGESAAGLNFVPVLWATDGDEAVALPLTQTNEDETITVYTNGAAYSINAIGQIVGEVIDAGGNSVAVLWALAAVTDDPEAIVHPSGYDEPITLGKGATAHFINADGWIVGETMTENGLRASLWIAGSEGVDLLEPLADHATSTAFGVDALGRIVGESIDTEDNIHAALWRAFDADAESLGADASAMAINNSNRIIGSATISDELRAAVWDTRATILDRSDAVLSSGSPDFIPTEGFSRAYGMSPNGLVVGTSDGSAFVAVPVMP
jgi:hypothetical protein